jgi:outer membrane protein assembly factor BamA
VTGVCQDTLIIRKAGRQEDVKDWLEQKGIMKKKKEKDDFLLIVPMIASNPSAGFIFGGALSYAFKALPCDTRVSTLNSNASYSTKGLLNLNVKTNAFIFGERMVLNGDWRFLYNSETTYGLGTSKSDAHPVDINGYETSSDSLGQNLSYYQVRVHQTGSWKVMRNFFAGLGFHYDYYYNISDQALKSGDTAHSWHYQYSVRNGFDPQRYSITGFSLNLLYDSRDNQVNAYKGSYANINYRINPEGLGSSKNSTLLLTEYRTYLSLDRQLYRHTLALWLYGNFVISGKAPYLLLPAIGYDQRQKTGRGYTFGRFRGEDMLYGEGEYRFPVSRNTGILGGVLFLNCTTASDRENDVRLFNYLRLAYGGGLRIMMDKKTRTRLQIDAGIANKTVGIYFGAQETF